MLNFQQVGIKGIPWMTDKDVRGQPCRASLLDYKYVVTKCG